MRIGQQWSKNNSIKWPVTKENQSQGRTSNNVTIAKNGTKLSRDLLINGPDVVIESQVYLKLELPYDCGKSVQRVYDIV